jgi:hypothetical protein
LIQGGTPLIRPLLFEKKGGHLLPVNGEKEEAATSVVPSPRLRAEG